MVDPDRGSPIGLIVALIIAAVLTWMVH